MSLLEYREFASGIPEKLERGQNFVQQAPFDSLIAKLPLPANFLRNPNDPRGLALFVHCTLTRRDEVGLLSSKKSELKIFLTRVESGIYFQFTQARDYLEQFPGLLEYTDRFWTGRSFLYTPLGELKPRFSPIMTLAYYQSTLRWMRLDGVDLETEPMGFATPEAVSDAARAAGKGQVRTTFTVYRNTK